MKYPLLYAPPEHKDAEAFNCLQRGHQNSLENLPAHLATTLIVGMRVRIAYQCGHLSQVFCRAEPQYAMQYPIFAAVTGLIYIIGRIFYFKVCTEPASAGPCKTHQSPDRTASNL